MSNSATPWTVACQLPCPRNSPVKNTGWPFASPGDLHDPRIEPMSPTLHAESLQSGPPGKQYCYFICLLQSDGSTQLLIVVFISAIYSFHKHLPCVGIGIPWSLWSVPAELTNPQGRCTGQHVVIACCDKSFPRDQPGCCGAQWTEWIAVPGGSG